MGGAARGKPRPSRTLGAVLGGDALTRKAFVRRLRVYGVASQADRGYAFFVFERRGDALVGGASLNQVRRGIGQSATLGY